ncbi:unnamed protein product [Vitrella brassicaformis CCMP3155]|uniref:Uncharacterized protein n=1 Tax=Vitrella brassicaformis (strain CCMP3155) TaxID=1169540 RepID=A0A0G4ENA3_VITBC|nr:unnamed protein product [Vitrella brassicaformis CCMP3155]|eukprot:CEL98311.1 unnamed protein product [Vitrella brassicaformis CCMP3155]
MLTRAQVAAKELEREAQEAARLAAAAASTGAIRLYDLHPFSNAEDDERLNKAAPKGHKKKTSAPKKDQRDGKTDANHNKPARAAARQPAARTGRARGKGSRETGDVQMADGEGEDVEMMAEEENDMLSTKANKPPRHAAAQQRRTAKAEVDDTDIHAAALIDQDEDEEPLHKRKKNKGRPQLAGQGLLHALAEAKTVSDENKVRIAESLLSADPSLATETDSNLQTALHRFCELPLRDPKRQEQLLDLLHAKGGAALIHTQD